VIDDAKIAEELKALLRAAQQIPHRELRRTIRSNPKLVVVRDALVHLVTEWERHGGGDEEGGAS
jgi:hypothetical protein